MKNTIKFRIMSFVDFPFVNSEYVSENKQRMSLDKKGG